MGSDILPLFTAKPLFVQQVKNLPGLEYEHVDLQIYVRQNVELKLSGKQEQAKRHC